MNEILDEIENKIEKIRIILESRQQNYIGMFFDDNITHINAFIEKFPKINSVLVDHTTPHKILQNQGILSKNNYTTNKQKIYSSSFTSKFSRISGNEKHMPTVGITDYQIKQLLEWSLQPNAKYVFFSWDGTLSVITEMIIPKSKLYKNTDVSYNNVINYCIGDKNRVKILKDMYDILCKNNIEIYIITNNSFARKTTENRLEFVNLIKQIFKDFNDEHLIYFSDIKNQQTDVLKSIFGNIFT